jgi:hypothetical protein
MPRCSHDVGSALRREAACHVRIVKLYKGRYVIRQKGKDLLPNRFSFFVNKFRASDVGLYELNRAPSN